MLKTTIQLINWARYGVCFSKFEYSKRFEYNIFIMRHWEAWSHKEKLVCGHGGEVLNSYSWHLILVIYYMLKGLTNLWIWLHTMFLPMNNYLWSIYDLHVDIIYGSWYFKKKYLPTSSQPTYISHSHMWHKGHYKWRHVVCKIVSK
jgi:hypothetical protein